MVTAVFVVTALIIIAGAGFALAGRWAPDGHPAQTDAVSDTTTMDGTGDPAFDVVLRGYRMDQVDAYIAHLQQRLAAVAISPPGTPAPGAAAGTAVGETPAGRGAPTGVDPQT